jgi:hypothetical protein
MATPSLRTSSNEDVEKRVPDDAGTQVKDVSDGQALHTNTDYERYLELHREFAGEGHKKLLRKRKSGSGRMLY